MHSYWTSNWKGAPNAEGLSAEAQAKRGGGGARAREIQSGVFPRQLHPSFRVAASFHSPSLSLFARATLVYSLNTDTFVRLIAAIAEGAGGEEDL